MRPIRLWDAWLMVVALGMTGFGIFMALFNQSLVFDGFNRQIDPVFWGASQTDPAVGQFQGWVYGVWGATVAGFGALAAFVIRGPFRARLPWARSAILTAVGLWFILDTGFSVWHGVWFNVGFNLVVLFSIAIPVVATWREFADASPA
jgi:hypothetical protein